MSIRLPKLPDRVPVKVTISLNPDLHRAVTEYSEIYRVTYGQDEAEPVAEILPFIIQDYIDNDKGFAKERRRRAEQSTANGSPRNPSEPNAKKQ